MPALTGTGRFAFTPLMLRQWQEHTGYSAGKADIAGRVPAQLWL